jgi:hypothetical protein
MKREKLFKDVYVNDGKSLYKNGKKIASFRHSVTVRTSEYEFVHGKKPRGYGHWAFLMAGNKQEVVFFTGMYSDCVKQAKARAQSLGYLGIAVGA